MTTPHPGNDYYVNVITGTIQRQSNPLLAAGLRATGFTGPLNWTDAKAISDSEKGRSAALGATSVGGAPALAAGMDVAHGMNWSNLLLRIGEVALGIVLVGVGIAKLTGASNIISTAVKAKI